MAFSISNCLHRCFSCHALCKVVIDDVAERGEVVVLPLAVHAVVDRDKPHIVLREADLCVHPYLQVVAAETGHILDDDRADEAAFNIGQHLLEARPVKVRTGVAVILVYPVIRDPMVSGVFGQDSDLRRDLSRVLCVLENVFINNRIIALQHREKQIGPFS